MSDIQLKRLIANTLTVASLSASIFVALKSNNDNQISKPVIFLPVVIFQSLPPQQKIKINPPDPAGN